eukprot:NODE_94_length_21515_cov_0.130417.p1 type:complete len:1082 gc:universal NODE_94_length_21515_cov_0.130417:10029-13274(+)
MQLQKVINPVGIQLIPKKWQQSLFNQERKPYIHELAELSKSHLQKHLPNRASSLAKVPEITIPRLLGGTLTNHFHTLGSRYLKDINPLIQLIINNNPVRPKEWSRKPGWTKYSIEPESIAYPTEQVYILDAEVLVPVSKYPILAVAKSRLYWYSWCAPWFHSTSDSAMSYVNSLDINRKLITFGENNKKLFIGHNVAYDRQRILEEYINPNCNYEYLDTLSMHITVCGLSSQQRPSYLKQNKLANEQIQPDKDMMNWNDLQTDKWVQETSTNSLLEVAKFHCKIHLNKAVRNVFVKGRIEEVQKNAQELFDYCADDVDATHEVFKVLYPKYLVKCPHPISQAGPMMMIKASLPISNRWDKFIKINEDKTVKIATDIENDLLNLAFKALDDIIIRGPLLPESITKTITPVTALKLEHHEYCTVDLKKLASRKHFCFLDWRIPCARFTIKGLPVKSQKLRNYPLWVHQLFTGKNLKLTHKMKHAVYLLETKYDGNIVCFHPIHGYCIVSNDTDRYQHLQCERFEAVFRASYKNKSKLSYSSKTNDDLVEQQESSLFKEFENSYFIRLSTQETMMGIFYTRQLTTQSKRISTCNKECLSNIFELSTNAAYWVSARKRIDSQFIVPVSRLPKHKGVVLPMVIPSGTVTRRSVEPTWVTAANVKKGRFGSDLKMQVEAPDSYKIIGADVDSEELWIASLLADGQFQMHGSSAIGFMTLQGIKKDGTDMHSVTAKLVGISRDEAKGFNYARIYGSGVQHAARTLEIGQQISQEDSQIKAKQLFLGTKGNKLDLRWVDKYKLPRKVWCGGTESMMFNILDNAADLSYPSTPTLRAVIPDTLLPMNVDRDFATTRINWIVQGSGVDYLHMLLVLMDYFIKRSRIDCKFMISVHDEIRYICHDADVYKASLMLQLSNLLTRAFFSERIGVYSLPLQCSFFSAVDVDTVLRKDPFTSSETFPDINHGYTMDINQLLKEINCDELVNSLETDEDYDSGHSVLPYIDMVTPFINNKKENHLKWLEMQIADNKDEFYEHANQLKEMIKEEMRTDECSRGKKDHMNKMGKTQKRSDADFFTEKVIIGIRKSGKKA